MPFQITVPAGPEAPGAARHAFTRWLTGRDVDGLARDAPLVVSELVTNSLRHGHLTDVATVRVTASMAAGVLRLEVEDAGTGGEVARRAADRELGGGFGLNIVDALSARWGVERNGSTLVWAELAC